MESELGYIMAYEETQSESVLKVEVLKRAEGILTVKHLDTQKLEEISEEEFFLIDPDAEQGLEDLSSLQSFNEVALLINLQSRYNSSKIYTKMHSNLLIINPYSPLPKETSPKKQKKFQKSSSKPHIFSIGFKAQKALRSEKTNQVVLISGESGAGKTESTKHLIQFLTSDSAQDDIERKVVSCSPILEAFGNSKTLKNNNSSRFGKFIKLFYDSCNEKIISASIESFLLEKSRVVHQADGERNFHVFYLMAKYLDLKSLKELMMVEANEGFVDFRKFRYLDCNGVTGQEKSDEEKMQFDEIIRAFAVNGFSSADVRAVWKALAGLLHIGNITFDDLDFNENCPCSLVDVTPAENAAKVLQVSLPELISCLTTFRRVLDKTEVLSPVNKSVCESLRDTLAKYIYDRVFTWILKKLNSILKLPKETPKGNYIGILDIYGFEKFPKNSFEQFCINFANEKLHQLSLHHFFKSEMEEMQKEGLSSHSASIEFSDNQSLIDVLEQAPSGIFRQIDEASTMKSTDEILLSSIHKKWKDSGFLSFSKTSSPVFTINHTATSITYTIDGFVSKNIDEVRPEFETFLCKSEEKTLKIVFRADEVKGKFIGEKFRKEVGILFQEISDSRTWFVRCIKPNEDKSPWKFDQRVVLNQIQYLGLLDSIMIRKKGFPVRISHEKFFENYKILKGFGFTEKIDDFFKFSEEFIRKLNSPEILLGKNKVFMKADAQEVLKNMKKERISLVENHVRRIQGWTRAQNMYENFKKLQKSVRVIQNAWKSHQNLKNFQMVRKKVVTIQRWYRSILYREQIAMKEFGLQIFYQYLKIKIEDLFLEKCFNLAIKTQKLFRGHRVRRLLKGKTLINKIFQKKSCKPAFDSILRETKEVSATRIQKTFRGYQIRSKITPQFTQMIQKNKKNRMATRIQKWFKGQLIRLKLLKITSAAVKIQSFMRSKLCQKHYLSTLTSLIKIQSSVRSYLTRSKAIRSRLHSFLSKETALINNLTVLELELLQSKHRKSEDSSSCQKVLRTLSNFSEVSQITSPKDPNLNISHHSNISHYSNISHNLNLSQISSHSQIHSKQVTPFHVEKIYFSLRPFEIEVLSDESVIYEGLWGRLLDCLAKDLSVKDEHVLDLAVGTCHSLALTSKGRLFAWGWNDKNQCGSNGNRPRLVDSGKDLKFVQVSAGEDHSLALASNGMVFAFGDNSRGQLGQGNYCEIKQGALLEIPSCKQVLAVNHQNMAVSASGELFIWPFETFNGEKRSFPMKVLNDFSVSEVTAGFNFAVILTTAGIVFSLGSENSFGQLGHGDLAPRSLPTMVLALKSFGEKIASVGCGQSHVIAKSTLGKVFTWGKGTEGQLGHGSLSNEYYPRLVTFRTQGKPIQISAGFRHSLVLTDSRKVLLSGKSSRFESVSSIFQEVNLSSTIQELQKIPSEFAVVRIHSIWSKIFSVMLVTLVDLRFLQGNSAGFSKVSNNLGLIASKWTGQNPEPPVIESISGFYPACLTRRAVKGGSIKTGKSVKGSEEVKEVVRDILRKPKEKWTSEDCATIECYASYEH